MSFNSPHFRFSLLTGADRSAMELVSGRDFRFGFEEIHQFFNGLPSRMEDLLRIAISVFVADRMTRRKQRARRNAWSREIKLNVNVHDQAYWSSDSISDNLHTLLNELSGDFWELEFQSCRREATKYQNSLLPYESSAEDSVVCPYSGGLDSAAGLAQRIGQGIQRVIPVIIHSQPNQRRLVSEQFRLFRQFSNAQISPLMVKAAMKWKNIPNRPKEESSQRARSFLFMSAGAVVAAMAGASTVEVFESGVGALNVPLMAGMVGSKATRGCHPQFLQQIGRLASEVVQREMKFTLPFIEQTKGEMVAWLNAHGLASVVNRTISCSSYPVRYGKQQPCGVCAACIFRRHAIAAGGIVENGRLYKYDLLSEAANSLVPERLEILKAFLLQAGRLRPDKNGNIPSGSIQTHLLNSGLANSGVIPSSIVDLLSRYREEWITFAERGAQNGATWPAMLLGVPKGGQNAELN
jgi:7-cyano-7-deazaguanine synthase in queuosine biosynthesis